MAKTTNTDDETTINREKALTTRQLSEFLGFASVTLQQQRERGEGPPFFRVGRSIRYRLGDVLDWRAARTVGGKRVSK